MPKITLTTLDQKIDFVIKQMEDNEKRTAAREENILKLIDENTKAEKLNTQFRLESKGALALIASVSGIIGGFIVMIVSKLIR
jgi:hypothetical protein